MLTYTLRLPAERHKQTKVLSFVLKCFSLENSFERERSTLGMVIQRRFVVIFISIWIPHVHAQYDEAIRMLMEYYNKPSLMTNSKAMLMVLLSEGYRVERR